jgi:hypothetical protein
LLNVFTASILSISVYTVEAGENSTGGIYGGERFTVNFLVLYPLVHLSEGARGREGGGAGTTI